jgi:hypothetical protein
MSRLSHFNDRALRIAGQVGDTIKDAVPDRAMRWMETGAALGAVKAGSRGAGRLVRRHPVALAAAAVAGAGLLVYALRKRAQRDAGRADQQDESEVSEGQARRVTARRRSRTQTARRRAEASGDASTGNAQA